MQSWEKYAESFDAGLKLVVNRLPIAVGNLGLLIWMSE